MCLCVFFLLEQKDSRFGGLPPVHTQFTVMMMLMMIFVVKLYCALAIIKQKLMHRLDYVGYVNVKQVNQLKFTATPTEIQKNNAPASRSI